MKLFVFSTLDKKLMDGLRYTFSLCWKRVLSFLIYSCHIYLCITLKTASMDTHTHTLKRVEDAEEEENYIRYWSGVEECQAPCRPKEAAEAPDAKESNAVLLPLIPVANLPVDQEEHHKA